MEFFGRLFTNQLQGRLFNMFRESIMGWKHFSELKKLLPPPSKECVGKMDEVKNINFSFKNKSYVDALLQK